MVPFALGKTFYTAPRVLIGVMTTTLPSLVLDSTTLVASSAHVNDQGNVNGGYGHSLDGLSHGQGCDDQPFPPCEHFQHLFLHVRKNLTNPMWLPTPTLLIPHYHLHLSMW